MAVKVPVTVATGFLGAGKTTLINQILTENHGKKIAVIENEFGEISIDRDLVNQKLGTSEEIFELNNGCICCKVRGDLIRILTKLLRRKNRLDHIIIETTGLADPGPVIQSFFTDDTLKEQLDLDAILTVVDGRHCLQHIQQDASSDRVNEAVQQIAFADRILLNKIDLISEGERATVNHVIKAINSQARLIECSLTASPPALDSILSLNAFNLDRILEADSKFMRAEATDEEPSTSQRCPDEHCTDSYCHLKHSHQHSDKHSHHHHDSGVTSVAIQREGLLEPQATNKWLGELLTDKGPDLYRSKGILNFAGDDFRTVFQGVQNMWQFNSGQEQHLREGGKSLNRLVFIGRNLDKESLQSSFEGCLVSEA